MESEAVKRLLSGVRDEGVKEILARCLDGSISPPVALMQMLIETEDAAVVRAGVDDVTRRAASLSRSGDSLLRDRVDDLTQLVIENERGCERIAEMLRSNMDRPDPAPSVDEGIAFCERLFDWSVQQSEEASVALYSLGSAELLERATKEIVAQLERWKVLSHDRRVLDIGCGIGRLEVDIAPRVSEVHGIDVSAQMINAALKRCAPLSNVHLLKVSGRNLAEYADNFFDAAIAIDTFPYIVQSGTPLVEQYFAEANRVLKPGGDFVILNFSYSDDEAGDEHAVRDLANRYSFDIVTAGARPFVLWDGLSFHLKKVPATTAEQVVRPL
ncbi:MAG TPA: class I SAM-dependent methyltransferase [Gemmatimonadaceae bacterium]|nr:class I SAM-dependent methyltransferase [Gemmatimonadaceae bacterium]